MGSRATGQAVQQGEGFDLKGNLALRFVCSHSIFSNLYFVCFVAIPMKLRYVIEVEQMQIQKPPKVTQNTLCSTAIRFSLQYPSSVPTLSTPSFPLQNHHSPVHHSVAAVSKLLFATRFALLVPT